MRYAGVFIIRSLFKAAVDTDGGVTVVVEIVVVVEVVGAAGLVLGLTHSADEKRKHPSASKSFVFFDTFMGFYQWDTGVSGNDVDGWGNAEAVG